MDKFIEGHFYSPTCGDLTLNEVINEVFCYIGQMPEKTYEIVVGCDSSSEEEPYFPVALVVLRNGAGGRFFLKKIKYSPFTKRFYNWRQRILEEVMLSCEFALFLRERLEKRTADSPSPGNYQFRYIHADVGGNGITKDMIKEVVGLIKGNGFEPKIKPEAYAASVVADRYT